MKMRKNRGEHEGEDRPFLPHDPPFFPPHEPAYGFFFMGCRDEDAGEMFLGCGGRDVGGVVLRREGAGGGGEICGGRDVGWSWGVFFGYLVWVGGEGSWGWGFVSNFVFFLIED